MLAIAIPPRVPERLNAKRTSRPTFGIESILLPPSIDFPREPMEPVLAEHARLLRAHAHEIALAVADEEAVRKGIPFTAADANVAVVVAAGDRHDVRGWLRQDASWVVRRCHGIVRELIAEPPDDRFYAIVIAGGVASLHLMAGTGQPTNWREGVRYTGEGLGAKVIARNLVVEPWEQWHMRRAGRMHTHWKLPCGATGEGDVEIPTRPRSLGEAVDRTLALHAARIPGALARFERMWRSTKLDRVVVLKCGRDFGDAFFVFPAADAELLAGCEWQPKITSLLGRSVKGYDAAFVVLDRGAGLRWLPRGEARDVAAPPAVNEVATDSGN